MCFPTWSDIPFSFRNNFLDEKGKTKAKKFQWMKAVWTEWFGSECVACGRSVHCDTDFSHLVDFLTIDHVLARSLGGTNEGSNLTCICRGCNSAKSNYESYMKSVLIEASEKHIEKSFDAAIRTLMKMQVRVEEFAMRG